MAQNKDEAGRLVRIELHATYDLCICILGYDLFSIVSLLVSFCERTSRRFQPEEGLLRDCDNFVNLGLQL